MAENLAIKGKLVWFGLVWFSLVWFGFWCCSLLRRSYSTYIPNLSSLSNLCILQLRLIYVDITKKSLTHKQTHKQTEFPTCRRLPFINGSLENARYFEIIAQECNMNSNLDFCHFHMSKITVCMMHDVKFLAYLVRCLTNSKF